MNPFDRRRQTPRAAHANNAYGDIWNCVPALRLRQVLFAGALAALASLATPLPAAAATETPPTLKLRAAPESVASGGSSTLTWTSTDATSCAAAGGWSGALATSGSKSTGALTAARSYTVTCKGAGGSTSETLTIYLSSEVPKITFSASPTNVEKGGYSTLTWSATNAEFCHGYGPWDSTEPVKGSSSTNGLTATSTFTLGCFNASGAKSSAKVTIAVSSGSGTTGSATLSWTAPTTNTNGTPVTPLKGYTIYYGTSESAMSKSLVVGGAASTSCEISGLTAGVWYFAIAADAQDGAQSATSEIGSLAI
jgi:hypothetical protein